VPINDYMTWAGNGDIGLHLPYLHQRAKAAKVALELGVRSGCSTAALLCGMEEGDGILWSVDIDQPQAPAYDWLGHPRWVFHQGDDVILAATDLLPAELDLLFIDSSHRYSHTLSELQLYGPRVKVGGVILLHDTELEVAPGSADDNDKGYPVRRAVQDWCRHVFLTPEWREGCNGLGVIEVT